MLVIITIYDNYDDNYDNYTIKYSEIIVISTIFFSQCRSDKTIKYFAKYIQIEIFFNKTTFVIDRIDL